MTRAFAHVVVLTALTAAALVAQEDHAPGLSDVFTKVRIDEPAPPELRLYPVGTYLAALVEAQGGLGPNLEFLTPPPAGGKWVVHGSDRRPPPDRPLLNGLRDAIRTFVEPPLDDGEVVEAIGDEHLAVIGRRQQHQWVECFLDLQQQSAATVATIDYVLLRVSPGDMEALGIGQQPRVLTADQAARFRSAMRGADGALSAGIETVHGPGFVTTLTLQRAHISALNRVAYIKDYDVVELDDGSTIVDPLIETVHEGLEFEGSFVVLAKDMLGVAWRVTTRDLLRPIPEFQKQVQGESVTFQLPDVTSATFEAEVALSPGELSVFPGPELRGHRLVLLMSIGKIEPAAVTEVRGEKRD